MLFRAYLSVAAKSDWNLLLYMWAPEQGWAVKLCPAGYRLGVPCQSSNSHLRVTGDTMGQEAGTMTPGAAMGYVRLCFALLGLVWSQGPAY